MQSGFLEVALESDNHHMLQIMEHDTFFPRVFIWVCYSLNIYNFLVHFGPLFAFLTETREIVIVENVRLVRLHELTADFGVKTNAKLLPIF